MRVLTMSDAELDKLEIIRDVDLERIPARAAAVVLGISERQVWRLLKRYRLQGAGGLISMKRGQPSNRRTPYDVRSAVMAIVRSNYADFGPTFAAEKLHELHDLGVSRETLRAWMIEDGLWQPRKKRRGRIYQPRYRRDCVGELIQIDGSEHRWFEGRGPKCTLLVYIDDATSRLMHLQFVQTESTFAYFKATRTYLETFGKPIAFYSDKHAVFRVNKPGGANTDGLTQFGRALSDLNIEIICANSSQAKGRVERANKTLQDRLVKELRLAGVSSMADGNTFLPSFIADYNARFAKLPANPKDLHRAMTDRDDLDDTFTWRVDRTLSQSLTLQYDKVLFILEPTEIAQSAIGKRVTVLDYPDGRLLIRYEGHELAYRTFDKIRQVKETNIVENKRLGSLLDLIKQSQDAHPVTARTVKAPKRRDQSSHMFNIG